MIIIRLKTKRNEGMLFVFDGSGTRSMWMLGMQFNLDVIWFDENANVVAIEKNVPLCETTIEVVACRENGVSGDNAKYVLEVTAGFVDKFNITDRTFTRLEARLNGCSWHHTWRIHIF